MLRQSLYPGSKLSMLPFQHIGMFLTSLALVILGYFLSPYLQRKYIHYKTGNPVPPGPLLRYIFLRKYPELAIHSWAKKYGPLFSIWMGSQLFIVISDPRVARELLVTHGAVFSSRKKYFMKNQVILRGRAVTASEYGDTWRQHRRIAMQVLTPKSMMSFTTAMDYEAHILIRTLYEDTLHGKVPINPAHYAGRFALNNMLLLSFGTRTSSTSVPLIKRTLDLAMEFMDLTGPWSNAIDFFEPLQWIPTNMHTRGRKVHDGLVDTYGRMILQVKSRLDAGEDVPDCLVKTLLETQQEEKLDWEDLCMLSAVFALGGVHSISGIIQWFLALLPSHPEVQQRAHEELDRVVGHDRWPNAEDEHDLPYIRAIIKESGKVQRVHTPFWMATPHCSSEDFTYQGYHIPKDTVVVLNCYTLHHNEDRYPDSFAFNPDRYFDDNLSCGESAKLADAMKRDHWAFGAGRRICLGLPAAERELWLVISRLLWAFTFEEVPGEPISLEEYEGLSGRTPLPFRLKLIPRAEKLHDVLQTKEEIVLD